MGLVVAIDDDDDDDDDVVVLVVGFRRDRERWSEDMTGPPFD